MAEFVPSKQVEKSHYDINYDTKKRFITYWYQIQEIITETPKSVLEIGSGTGVTSNYLKRKGLDVTTLDIDSELNPDVRGSIHKLPFANNKFDVVAAFEVLEHIPYDLFKSALDELNRVTKEKLIISVPDARRHWKISLRALGIRKFRKLITVPRLWEEKHQFDGEHYWELGKKNYPLTKIKKTITDKNFEIQNDYRVFESPGKHFFILKPIS